MFEEERKKREAEEAQRRSGGFNTEYDEVDYASLGEVDELKVFRLIGNPVGARCENYDPKMVLSSKIVDDKNKQFTCKWPEDRKWLLWRVYDTVMAYTWDKDFVRPDGKTGCKVYNIAKSQPEMLDKVLHNNKAPQIYEGKKIEDKGWYPTRAIWFNCISRDDYAWHVENKSFKLLAKKSNTVTGTDGKETTYYESGIGTKMYDSILKTVVEEHGAWEDFDIAICRENVDPWHSIYSAMDARKIEKRLAPDTVMNSNPLTEEELSWKKFDIDKYTQITSYRKIQNRLGEFIKLVDAVFNTKYTAELEALVAEEKAKWDAEKAEKDKEEAEEGVTLEQPEAKKEEPKTRTRTTTVAEGDLWSKLKSAGWKQVDKLKDELGDDVKDVILDADPKKVKFVIESDGEVFNDYIECPDCHVFGPSSINFCPNCGAEFK